jgi:F-type H+-transporting ATPase subunit epsilon
MANTIHVDVVSAEEQIFSGEAEFVVLPASRASSASILAIRRSSRRSSPARCASAPGQANEELVFVQGGFLEVQPRA